MGYNLPGVTDLVLSRSVLASIFSGDVSQWNDPQLQRLNPNISLPFASIVRIVRSDKSGSTEIFTSGLSSFSNRWREEYGAFSLGLNKVRKYIIDIHVLNLQLLEVFSFE